MTRLNPKPLSTLLAAFALALLAAAPAYATARAYGQRKAARPLIRALVKDGFSAAYVRRILDGARQQPSIIHSMEHPAEALPWYRYRHIFLGRGRIRAGAAFVRAHWHTLRRAQARYGVPPTVIAAILGVETRYGAHIGRYRVIDALSTLAFDYPPRERYFRQQLQQFFLMSRKAHVNPARVKGSYAGAMGLPQFMPSSYRSYAVDFNHDGRIDLWQPSDAIGSVANYLARNGWRRGGLLAMAARLTNGRHSPAANSGWRADSTVGSLRRDGVTAAQRLNPRLAVTLVKLQRKHGYGYWLVAHNFFVITRYNHSRLYAMAVFQLARAIHRDLAQHGGGAG